LEPWEAEVIQTRVYLAPLVSVTDPATGAVTQQYKTTTHLPECGGSMGAEMAA
jgi:hypothetical protein